MKKVKMTIATKGTLMRLSPVVTLSILFAECTIQQGQNFQLELLNTNLAAIWPVNAVRVFVFDTNLINFQVELFMKGFYYEMSTVEEGDGCSETNCNNAKWTPWESGTSELMCNWKLLILLMSILFNKIWNNLIKFSWLIIYISLDELTQ